MILAALLCTAPAASGQGAPERVVSINLCTDILALQLGVRPVAVSAFAADPGYSPVAVRAKGIPVTSGRAEEVLRLRPDHVLAGRYTARFAVRLLRRAGVRVTEIPPAHGFEDIRRNVRAVAEALGRRQAGERAVARFNAALEELRARALSPRRSAVVYLSNGYTSGAGSLYNEVLDLIGLDNAAARMDMGPYGFLTVEQLLRAAPDIIIRAPANPKAPALASEKLNHRALRRYARDHLLITAPSTDWFCGTPRVAVAARRILDAVATPLPPGEGGARAAHAAWEGEGRREDSGR